MSEQFKPGDKVNDMTTYTVMATMGLADGSQRLSLEEPVANNSSAYRIAEPSIPVSKIRELFLGHIQAPTNDFGHNSNLMAMLIGHNDCLHTVFEELTGEPLRKEST